MRLSALLLLLASGCYAQGPWHVDERFAAEERAEIQQAADVWTAPVDLIWDQRVTAFDTGRRVIVRVDRTTMEVASPGARERPNVRGVTQDGDRILIQPDGMVAPMWYIVAHELGHGMGLSHVDDESALMHWAMTDKTAYCVTSADTEEYYRVNGLRIRVGCASRSSASSP